MPRFRDRVKEASNSTGQGDFTLTGTSTGFQSFNTAFGIGPSFMYCIVDNASGLWETGVGSLSASSTLLREDVVDGSSGPGAKVNITSGLKDVFATVAGPWLSHSISGGALARMRGLALP